MRKITANIYFGANDTFNARGFGYDDSCLILINSQSKSMKIKLHAIQQLKHLDIKEESSYAMPPPDVLLVRSDMNDASLL